MREVVIVAAVRTAIGRSKGALSQVRADDLAADVLQEVVKRAGIGKEQVDDVILGCVTQTAEQGANIARTSLLMAGFPDSVPGVTIDRQCGSSHALRSTGNFSGGYGHCHCWWGRKYVKSTNGLKHATCPC